MDLIPILRTLFHRRRWLVAVLVLAVATGVVLGPGGVRSTPAATVGVASLDVLVTTPRAAAADLTASTDPDPVGVRPLLLGALLATPPVEQRMAARAQIARNALTVDPVDLDGSPLAPSQVALHASQTPAVETSHRVEVRAEAGLPILHLRTEAPTPGAARDLALAAVGALRDREPDLAADPRATADAPSILSRLGAASVGTRTTGSTPLLPWAGAILVLGLGAAAIVLADGLARRVWRPRLTAPSLALRG